MGQPRFTLPGLHMGTEKGRALVTQGDKQWPSTTCATCVQWDAVQSPCSQGILGCPATMEVRIHSQTTPGQLLLAPSDESMFSICLQVPSLISLPVRLSSLGNLE